MYIVVVIVVRVDTDTHADNVHKYREMCRSETVRADL